MMKRLGSYIYSLMDLLMLPSSTYCFYFLSIFLLMVAPDLFFYVFEGQIPIKLFFSCLFVAYGLTLFRRIFHKRKILENFYVYFTYFFVLTFFLIDLFCTIILDCPFGQDHVAIILGTNMNEAKEFAQMLMSSPSNWLFILCAASLFFLCVYLDRKLIVCLRNKCLNYIIIVAVCLGAICAARSKSSNSNIFQKVALFFKMEVPKDLSLYYSHPKLTTSDKQMPKNVIVVFGESLSKYHCSLYGYAKNTNPIFTQMRDSGEIFVFSDVEASATSTVKAFKCMMGTYSWSQGDSVDWFRCTTFLEIFQQLGYRTYWFSNQNKGGANDNVVTKFAELCDEVYFSGDKYSLTDRSSLDEGVLNLFNRVEGLGGNRLFVFHLMGSHFDFKKRYPSKFSKFHASEYNEYLSHQRENIAAYDNSVLYNDFVVSEIFKQYQNEESIAIYVPDHALDIYQTTDDYVGHARGNDKSAKYGKAIPFYIYMSKIYQKMHPDIVLKVQRNLHSHFETENLIYLLMDILGVNFEDNEDVKEKTLLMK